MYVALEDGSRRPQVLSKPAFRAPNRRSEGHRHPPQRPTIKADLRGRRPGDPAPAREDGK